HSLYIRNCLDGLINQRTNFDFEILIHDDASNDSTQEIIQEYAARFPDKIFPVYQQENQYRKGVRGIMARFNFPRARGKYIALCEGDDYWTDPDKLQKQVDFLEVNPEYVLCFHRAQVLVNNELKPDPLEERFNKISQRPIRKMDLLQQSNFIQTHSVVFRNVVSEFPTEFKNSPAGDLLLYIELANHGFIHRMDDVMGVYRMGSGVYSTLDPFNLKKQKLKLEIAIVSMLNAEDEKEVVIKKIFQTLDQMKNPLAKVNIYESLKDVVSYKLIFEILVYKFKSRFGLIRKEQADS
ncbi:MAG: glycosyltransferase family 2 protein, partial [Flavobacteriales bacterium]